jgi:hypothetical protein
MKKTINIATIPPDKQVTMTIGGIFYQRLNKLLIEFGDSVSKEKLILASELIKINKSEQDNFAYNFETIIILVRDIEQRFKEEGFVTEQEIEIDLPDLTKPPPKT